MYEVSVVNEILELCGFRRKNKSNRRIEEIKLRLGALSPIDESKITNYFNISKRGTLLNDTTLVVCREKIYTKCFQCGHDSDLEEGKVFCQNCKSDFVSIIAEDSYYIEEIKVI